MRRKIGKITFERDILHAQAFGVWFYLQVGTWGLKCGRGCSNGIRIVWKGLYPRIKKVKFKISENQKNVKV